MKEYDIQLALAEHFNTRISNSVPNISWGLLNYEADLIVVTKAGVIKEIEIKTSKSDLKNDIKKDMGIMIDTLTNCFLQYLKIFYNRVFSIYQPVQEFTR